jgi:hypothetical protein
MTEADLAVSSSNPLFFGEGFLHDHVGQILDDPSIAILELVANSYDAGADKVTVIWPDLPGEILSISDNGTGMTRQQFERRWRTLSYDRQAEQGADVEFPPDVRKRKRTAFGHNGKGRFSPFCFADKYEIETWRDGNCLRATVELTRERTVPFSCSIDEEFTKKGHGTKVSVRPSSIALAGGSIRDLIGFKFAVDPSFQVMVNGEQVKLLELAALSSQDVPVDGLGTVRLHRLDPRKQERTIHLKGIAWWVNKRMVGEPSWDGLDAEGKYLDGRTSEAKRFSFVVEANILREQVKSDWSGFHANSRVNAVRLAIHDAVVQELRGLLADERKETKKAALTQNRALIKDLPQISRNQIGRFLEQIQEKCPNLTARDLGRTVEIWGKLEQSRTGYDLLGRLASCAPEDLDTWNRLMEQWTASNAEVVLNELDRRIKLIRQLQTLIRDKNTDEVHDLQPLFERGLWMFGPEYESVEFSSNRGMAHVIREFLGKKGAVVSTNRPDFVALPDSSIGIYSADEFKDGEVSAIRKVLIVELKKGGFEVKQHELDQARDYAKELRSTQSVQPTTKIEGFVLGASIEQGLEEMRIGETVVRPFQYDLLLNRAHSRIFNLAKRIKESSPKVDSDVEVEDVLSQQFDFDGVGEFESAASVSSLK